MKVTVRRNIAVCSALAALLTFSFQSAAQNPGASAPPRPSHGSGPYQAVMEMDAGLPDHTIYRPEDLSGLNGAKLPVVVWGNGACVDAGNAFRNFLTDIASYGYLVVALGPIVQRDVFAARPPQAPAAPRTPTDTTQVPRNLPPAATHPSQMIDAINWAIAENNRAGSKYYKHLDSQKIAVMGQSCGGVQAIEVAADRRVTTAVIWNSGLFAKPTNMGGGKTLSKTDLGSIHVPIAYISGDAQDIAFKNANADFDYLTKIPAFRGYERGVGHGGTYLQPNGGEFSGVGVAWLDWQLKGDQRAARMFRGPECGLCVNPKWVVRTKNLR
jgi:dienelactone hydrolase